MDPTNTNTAHASAFTEELARSGVRQAVISPGSRSAPLALALWRQREIDVTVVIDERSAGFFALGAAHASSRPVALLCTSGTAAANYAPAVAEADLSAVPLIVLSADRPPELRDTGAGQTIDQIKLFGNAVRWFAEVGSHQADDDGLVHLRSLACRAWAKASGDPRPGPVHLNFPFRDPLDPSPVKGAVSATGELAKEGRPPDPLTRVLTAVPTLGADSVKRIQALIEKSDRTLIVAGRQTDPRLCEPLTALAARIDAPILAEPTSQLRCGPHDRSRVVSNYGRIATTGSASLAPDLVLRFGEMPTSKPLRLWLASLDDLTQVVVDPLFAWNEPTRIADLIVRSSPLSLLDQLSVGLAQRQPGAFCNEWLELERIEASAVSSIGELGGIVACDVHRAIATASGDGDLVYTSSSMAIRDQEAFVPSGPASVLFLANRGANGIDGVLASGIGAAAATGRPATIIAGDLGFQHDVGSLALLDAGQQSVKVVVLNNGGGAIFARLPQKQTMDATEFDALMTTPGRLRIESAAAMFDLPYTLVTESSELEPALAGPAVVIEIPVPA